MKFRSIVRSVLLVASMFCLVACENQEYKDRQAAIQGKMQSMGPSDGGVKFLKSMSPFQKESAFAKEIEKPALKSMPSDGNPVKLRWSFGAPKTYYYLYEQKMNSKQRYYDESAESHLNVKSTVMVQSLGARKAKIVVEDVVGTTEFQKAGQKSKTVPTGDFPSYEIPGFSEESVVSGQAVSGMSRFFPIVFPLPIEEMKIGSKSKISLTLPMNAVKFNTKGVGYTELTLVDFVEVDGHRCALLAAEFSIDQPDVQTIHPGKFGFLVTGSGWLVFDIDDRCFHSGEMALIASVRAKMDAPKNNKYRIEVPGSMMSEIDSDVWIRFKRTPTAPTKPSSKPPANSVPLAPPTGKAGSAE